MSPASQLAPTPDPVCCCTNGPAAKRPQVLAASDAAGSLAAFCMRWRPALSSQPGSDGCCMQGRAASGWPGCCMVAEAWMQRTRTYALAWDLPSSMPALWGCPYVCSSWPWLGRFGIWLAKSNSTAGGRWSPASARSSFRSEFWMLYDGCWRWQARPAPAILPSPWLPYMVCKHC